MTLAKSFACSLILLAFLTNTAAAATPQISYQFDEVVYNNVDGEVIDSINGLNGRAINTQPVEGKVCNAVDLSASGISDYVILDNTVVGSINDFSISVWVKTPKTSNQAVVSGAADGDNNELLMWFPSHTNFGPHLNDGSPPSISHSSIAGDTWKHLVWTRSGAQNCLYIDKALQGCANASTSTLNVESFILGQEQDSVGGGFDLGQAFEGLIDELLIFDEAITLTDVEQIYDNQNVGLNYDGSTRNCGPNEVVAGRVTLNNTSYFPQFSQVCFTEPFSTVPRIFSIPTTADNNDRLALRIRNVTTSGFEIAQVESPESANPNPPDGNVSQVVDFIAITEGDYALPSGGKMRVSSIDTTSHQGTFISGAQWDTVNIADVGFSQPPALISALQTMNNESEPFPISNPFLATTIQNVTNNSFQMAIERVETRGAILGNNETIGYMAVTPGISGDLTAGINFETIFSNQFVRGSSDGCFGVNFNGSYGSDLPIVIASQNSRFGNNGGWLKRCSLTSNNVGLSVVEDMDNDTESSHVAENAGIIVLDGSFSDMTCNAPIAAVNHYQIIHDGEGLTCDAETVTIKACATIYNGTCIESNANVSLDVQATGTNNVSVPVSFVGTTTVNIPYTQPENVTLSIANASVAALESTRCLNGSVENCSMNFVDAGFRFLDGNSGSDQTISNQVAGTSFPIRIQAVENTNGVCQGLLNGNQIVALSQENIQPGGNSGLAFEVNNDIVGKHPTTTDVTLNFDAQSIAALPQAVYQDAGQIRLHASFTSGDINIAGTSSNFWVSPARLEIRALASAQPLDGASSTTLTTHKAGESFEFITTAYNAADVVTPNYSPGQLQMRLERTGPTLRDSVDGVLTVNGGTTITSSVTPSFQNISLAAFLSGVSTYTNANYSEVGLLNAQVRDANYGNSGIIVNSNALNIGRFTPHHFEQTVVEQGVFTSRCNGMSNFETYSGQRNESDNSIGAIRYLTNPVLQITAFNQQGSITRNYFEDADGSVNDFMKLMANNVSMVAPTTDNVALGANALALPVVSSISSGTLSQNDLTALPTISPLPRGILHYQLSSDDNFYYERSANARVAPFTSSKTLVLNNIEDSDGITASSTANATPTGIEVKFGRKRLENSFGPETENLTQPVKIEFYDGSTFVTANTDDCSLIEPSNFTLLNISLDPALSAVIGSTTRVNQGLSFDIQVQAPGQGNRGEIGVTYDTSPWLEYDWDGNGVYNDDPSSIITFGVYRGDDRTLHWREVFEE